MLEPRPDCNHIELVLPAGRRFVRLARLVAAGVASVSAGSYEDGEDLRTAVGEAFLILGDTDDRDGKVTVYFDVDDEGVIVEATVPPQRPRPETLPDPLAEHILTSVVDRYAIRSDLCSVWLYKRFGASVVGT